MSQSNASLAALVGSRLCHDLISPVGAIQNGLELLGLSGADLTSPEMMLIQESCESAAARIRFFRVAFGSASDGQNMSRREIVAILDGVAKGERLRGIWRPEGDQPREAVQAAYLAYLCCESALPQGGEVEIDAEGGRWTVRATGPRTNPSERLWQMLERPLDTTEISADVVQFALLRSLADRHGLTITQDMAALSITLDGL